MGARTAALPKEIVEAARFLWHQENDEGSSLLTIEEIAAIVGVPYGTVSSIAYRKGFRKRVSSGDWLQEVESVEAVPEEHVVAMNDAIARHRLRDAAPDLLAACEMHIEHLSDFSDERAQVLAARGYKWAERLLFARQAIKKARGDA